MNISSPIAFVSAAAVLAVLLPAQQQPPEQNPWTHAELMEPDSLARELKGAHAPVIISVAFPVLYRNRHILHAVDAGAASRPEGIMALKALVANTPKSADIVIYCGCCPMTKCPNIRPAYRTLKDLGFTKVHVVNIPANMHQDWYSKGYPSEPGKPQAGSEQ